MAVDERTLTAGLDALEVPTVPKVSRGRKIWKSTWPKLLAVLDETGAHLAWCSGVLCCFRLVINGRRFADIWRLCRGRFGRIRGDALAASGKQSSARHNDRQSHRCRLP